MDDKHSGVSNEAENVEIVKSFSQEDNQIKNVTDLQKIKIDFKCDDFNL